MNKRPAKCHPNKPHYAKGLCSACYIKSRPKPKLEGTQAERRAKWQIEIEGQEEPLKKQGRPFGSKTNEDTQSLLRKKTRVITQKLIDACQRPNPSPANLKLFFDLMLEKAEKEKIELSADEYFIIRQEAIKRIQGLSEQADRNRGVQSEPNILPDQLCVDTE